MIKPINLTRQKAEEMVKAAVDERGSDFIYEKPSSFGDCMYVHNSDSEDAYAGCGIGLAFALEGVPLETLNEYEHNDATNLVSQLKVVGVLESFEHQARGFMQNFQAKQDVGYTWGDAYEYALTAVVEDVFDDDEF